MQRPREDDEDAREAKRARPNEVVPGEEHESPWITRDVFDKFTEDIINADPTALPGLLGLNRRTAARRGQLPNTAEFWRNLATARFGEDHPLRVRLDWMMKMAETLDFETIVPQLVTRLNDHMTRMRAEDSFWPKFWAKEIEEVLGLSFDALLSLDPLDNAAQNAVFPHLNKMHAPGRSNKLAVERDRGMAKTAHAQYVAQQLLIWASAVLATEERLEAINRYLVRKADFEGAETTFDVVAPGGSMTLSVHPRRRLPDSFLKNAASLVRGRWFKQSGNDAHATNGAFIRMTVRCARTQYNPMWMYWPFTHNEEGPYPVRLPNGSVTIGGMEPFLLSAPFVDNPYETPHRQVRAAEDRIPGGYSWNPATLTFSSVQRFEADANDARIHVDASIVRMDLLPAWNTPNERNRVLSRIIAIWTDLSSCLSPPNTGMQAFGDLAKTIFALCKYYDIMVNEHRCYVDGTGLTKFLTGEAFTWDMLSEHDLIEIAAFVLTVQKFMEEMAALIGQLQDLKRAAPTSHPELLRAMAACSLCAEEPSAFVDPETRAAFCADCAGAL